ncbi:S-methyl-5-thioribose-1-phosphate isomerase [Bacidia gigantensis]|uniref:S-methyl-5-thioribose-1-phosphate isomerase n=1 Tax=Bacidia gigantensis TaxID=2732470 RepID=UPI001D0387B1|nr:S-methyl-5-thioribose-1-phosphate isomerase [Bacidia gigantensis]KAG8525459.1 S-methyl-5-thioribose-1-phosphate isomerase [Bacidia gigantensis]
MAFNTLTKVSQKKSQHCAMMLQAIKYRNGKLEILDQLRLPHEQLYVQICDPQDGWNAIKSMQVRGAPAIAIVATLSLAAWLSNEDVSKYSNDFSIVTVITNSLKFLVTSRPTAVNLLDAALKLERTIITARNRPGSSLGKIVQAYLSAAENMLRDDISDNESIGGHGAQWITDKCLGSRSDDQISVVTHCNTGSLATAGHGTALGVVRSLHSRQLLRRVFYTETRPYNQGARLTGFELLHDQIPAELVADSMVAALLGRRKDKDSIGCIVVGADRVAANGDTANKIGTYSLAIIAKYHGLKFLVAAPRTTIDLKTTCGANIVIEQRSPEEMITVEGPEVSASGEVLTQEKAKRISIAPIGTHVWNPSFDVTPADLIDGIITEKGVMEKGAGGTFHFDNIFKNEERSPSTPDYGTNSSQLTNGDNPSMSWDQAVGMKAEQHKTFAQWMFDLGTPIN